MIQTMEIHKKPSKTKSKTIFGSRKSLFGPFMLYHFYIEKVRFLPYPAILKRKCLELGIEFWHSVKSVDFVLKSSFIQTQHVFYPSTPPIALSFLIIFVHNLAKFQVSTQFLVLLYKKTWFRDITILSLGTRFWLKLASFC